MRRRDQIWLSLLVLAVIIIPPFTAALFGNHSNNAIVATQREACLRAVTKNVAAINSIRGSVVSDEVAATLPGLPKVIRVSRGQEITKDNTYALILDSQTDRSGWQQLDSLIDQHAVLHGVNGKPPFSCVKAYPSSKLF